jgi:hypothetical protein
MGGLAMERPDSHAFRLIGQRLRTNWREVETAPLPIRITMLLEQLKRREALPPQTVHLEGWPRTVATGSAKIADGERSGTMGPPDRFVMADA